MKSGENNQIIIPIQKNLISSLEYFKKRDQVFGKMNIINILKRISPKSLQLGLLLFDNFSEYPDEEDPEEDPAPLSLPLSCDISYLSSDLQIKRTIVIINTL